MYYMLMCQTPLGAESALTSYDPDRMPTGFRRNWITGKRFATVPAEPILVEIEEGESGLLLELITGAIPLMTRRLANALTAPLSAAARKVAAWRRCSMLEFKLQLVRAR